MMKNEDNIIVIPDVHGRSIWSDIVKKEVEDNPNVSFIFLGDYFDSFNIASKPQYDNAKAIIELSKDKDVVYLFGNHDLHYIDYNALCSGYNYSTYKLINDDEEVVNFLKKRCVAAFKVGNFLFSHAGISGEWLKRIHLESDSYINMSYEALKVKKYERALYFYELDYSRCGNNSKQGLVWVRPTHIDLSWSKDTIQVVGHTPLRGGIQVIEDGSNKLILCDCHDDRGTKFEYLKINAKEGTYEIKTIEKDEE